jgi:hypothetical protein
MIIYCTKNVAAGVVIGRSKKDRLKPEAPALRGVSLRKAF